MAAYVLKFFFRLLKHFSCTYNIASTKKLNSHNTYSLIKFKFFASHRQIYPSKMKCFDIASNFQSPISDTFLNCCFSSTTNFGYYWFLKNSTCVLSFISSRRFRISPIIVYKLNYDRYERTKKTNESFISLQHWTHKQQKCTTSTPLIKRNEVSRR